MVAIVATNVCLVAAPTCHNHEHVLPLLRRMVPVWKKHEARSAGRTSGLIHYSVWWAGEVEK